MHISKYDLLSDLRLTIIYLYITTNITFHIIRFLQKEFQRLFTEALRIWSSIRFLLYIIRIANRNLWSICCQNYRKHATKCTFKI